MLLRLNFVLYFGVINLLWSCGGSDSPAGASIGTQSAWSGGKPMPTPRQEVAAATLEGKIYVFGGLGVDGSTLATAERYNPEKDAWEVILPLPIPLNHAAATAVGGKIYVFGGSQTFPLVPERVVFALDPISGSWSSRTGMPFPRAALAVATVGETVYVIGGVGESPEFVMEYSPSADQWTVKAAVMPTLREHHATAATNNVIYVFSGRWIGENIASVEAYDPLNDDWSTKAPIPTKRSGLAASAVNDTIYVLGGEIPGVFATNERYLVTTDRWEKAESMSTARHGLAAANVNRKIYAIGGGLVAGLDPSTVVEVFSP